MNLSSGSLPIMCYYCPDKKSIFNYIYWVSFNCFIKLTLRGFPVLLCLWYNKLTDCSQPTHPLKKNYEYLKTKYFNTWKYLLQVKGCEWMIKDKIIGTLQLFKGFTECFKRRESSLILSREYYIAELTMFLLYFLLVSISLSSFSLFSWSDVVLC